MIIQVSINSNGKFFVNRWAKCIMVYSVGIPQKPIFSVDFKKL